jgi:hypothetical protein
MKTRDKLPTSHFEALLYAPFWAKCERMGKAAKAHLWTRWPGRMEDRSQTACGMVYITQTLSMADEQTARCKTCARKDGGSA